MKRSEHRLVGTVAGIIAAVWALAASAQAADASGTAKKAEAAPTAETKTPAAETKAATPDAGAAGTGAAGAAGAAGEPKTTSTEAQTAATDVKLATVVANTAAAGAVEATVAAKVATVEANAAAKNAKDAQAHSFLDARCALAICPWGTALGIEPLVELPFGKSFSASNGAVADYVNNHDLHIDLAAGVRVWMFEDIISLAVYLSKPLTDHTVRIPGSVFEYPATALRRPYPGVALGLLYDTLWVGLDHDELRNPDGTSGIARDATYPPNALVGSSWTVTVAIQPVTAFRNGIGAAKATEKKP